MTDDTPIVPQDYIGHGADMRKHYTRVRLPTRAHVTVELPKRKSQ